MKHHHKRHYHKVKEEKSMSILDKFTKDEFTSFPEQFEKAELTPIMNTYGAKEKSISLLDKFV